MFNLHNIEEWIQHKQHPNTWNKYQLTHFGYITAEQELCLAKVLDLNMSNKTIRKFLKIDDPKQFDRKKYQRKMWFKIQIGNANETNFCTDSNNVLLANKNQLLLLPFPISQNESDYTKNVENIDNNGIKWIITNQIFKKARILCMNAMYYAKKGDWDSFFAKFIQKIDVMCILFLIN